MTWLVRLGTKRGRGLYVSRSTELHCIRGMPPWTWQVHEQWAARRFELRDLAELYAEEHGGRVVRLRRKR